MGKSLLIFLLMVWTCGCASGTPFDHSHALYGKVLAKFNKGGLVDYAGLKASPEELNSYLSQLSSVSKKQFGQWHKGQQIAFLLNLYNAAVLKQVIGKYPVSTFQETKGSGRKAEDLAVVRLFGRKVSLNYLEDQMLRPGYPEPRIHFALAGAALGSPTLREEPYTPEKLDAQLAEQALRFMSNPAKNRIDLQEQVIYLSPIFQWYAADFEKSTGTMLKYVVQFYPPPVRERIKKSKVQFRYTEFDGALNDLNPSKPKETTEAAKIAKGRTD